MCTKGGKKRRKKGEETKSLSLHFIHRNFSASLHLVRVTASAFLPPQALVPLGVKHSTLAVIESKNTLRCELPPTPRLELENAMSSLRELWQSGFRALHIEEIIGNAFADFAPYAGADEQRILVTRNTTLSVAAAAVGTPLGPASHLSSSTALIMEDSGDFTVQARDTNAGCITFSTAGTLQLEAAVRVPLPLPSNSATTVAAPSNEGDVAPLRLVSKPTPAQLRFADFTRPVQSPPTQQAPPFPPPGAAAGPLGQAEVELSLPDRDVNRQSLGVRVGPAAVRLTRTFSAAATATATEAATSQLLSETQHSDEDELARTLLMERARTYQHTVDAALCLALGRGSDCKPPLPQSKEGDTEATYVTLTMQGEEIALRRAPWSLTCGLQYPMGIGDTLVGLSLQNDRPTSVVLPHPGVSWAVSAPVAAAASSLSVQQQRESGESAEAPICVPCVPSSYNARASALPSYMVLPQWTYRFLLVQTLASHTLVRDTSPMPSILRDDSGDASLNTSGATRLASSYDWQRLPTLIGVNVGIDRERLRLSVASIVHDAAMDLEVAGVLDMTPWTPRLPTLVKVGYNNVGRFAAGITTLFYETVTATLGVHIAPGEQARFGIEVKF